MSADASFAEPAFAEKTDHLETELKTVLLTRGRASLLRCREAAVEGVRGNDRLRAGNQTVLRRWRRCIG
jgi:hypothetical protein